MNYPNLSVSPSPCASVMEIRAEKSEDVKAIYQVNVTAFGRKSEADLVDRLRGVRSTFSFVVVESEQIIGHIFFSPVRIGQSGCSVNEGDSGDDAGFLGLAPVAVLPDYQGQGIGSLLIRHGLKECDRLGFKAIVVLGSPNYYQRFGFIPAKEKQLNCEYPVPDEAFMVLELKKGVLEGWVGLVKYRSEFNQLE
jgi:putative acetyltransferase